MRNFPIRTVIVVVWLAAMGWFVRYEAFPGWFTGALAGYKSLLSEGEVYSDSWMNIEFKGHKIGYNHTQVEMDDTHPTVRYTMTSKSSMTLDLGGERQNINVGTTTRLDAFQRLVSFEFSMSARRYTMEVKGSRRNGDQFRVVVRSGAASHSTTVRIPDDVVIYSPMTMMAMGRMKPGETSKLRTFDPMSIEKGGIAVEDVLVKALEKKSITWGTNTTEATVLSVNYNGMEMTAYVDGDGRVLREETPFGWAMVAATADEALREDRSAGAARLDLLTELGVPVKGSIKNPDACKELSLDLHGLNFSLRDVASPRMQVEPGTNGALRITLRKAADFPADPLEPAVRENALAATPFIQSDDPAMRAKAEEITRGISDARTQALAIKEWVYKSVRKNLTASIPSALDVLKQREGDCNEHTYLYVALARAAGLPAQVRAGIVYKEGRYLYHAWPAVHIGRWLELDPTWNEDEAGVAHITLLQGELSSQAKLMGAIGRLRIEVVEQKY